MNDIFSFIGVKNIQTSLLLDTLYEAISLQKLHYSNLYLSIYPPVENFTLVEFADFIPITRYRDVDVSKFIKPLSYSFQSVYFIEKNEQILKSKFQKFFNGKLEREFKGEDAVEKGIKYELILDYSQIVDNAESIWQQGADLNSVEPVIHQICKNNENLTEPLNISVSDFYGLSVRK